MQQPYVSNANAQASTAMTTMALIWYAILVGLFTVLGETGRWSSVSFMTAKSVPGSPGTWGWAAFAFGLMSAIAYWGKLKRGARRVLSGGLFMCSVWSVFLGISFLRAYITVPEASGLGFIFCGMMAMLYMAKAALYWNTTDWSPRPVALPRERDK